VRLSGLRILLL